jgi:hypothetical protein
MITGDYSIVIDGEFTTDLQQAFAPAEVTVGWGKTVLHIRDADQAALHGLIDRLGDLGLTLLDVHCEST